MTRIHTFQHCSYTPRSGVFSVRLQVRGRSSNMQYLMKEDLGLASGKGSSNDWTHILSICNYRRQGGIVDDPLLLQLQLLLVRRLHGHATTRAHPSKLGHDGRLRRRSSYFFFFRHHQGTCTRFSCSRRQKTALLTRGSCRTGRASDARNLWWCEMLLWSCLLSLTPHCNAERVTGQVLYHLQKKTCLYIKA